MPDINDDSRWLECDRGWEPMEGTGGTSQSRQLSTVRREGERETEKERRERRRYGDREGERFCYQM